MSNGRSMEENMESIKVECPDADYPSQGAIAQYDDEMDVKDAQNIFRSKDHTVYLSPVQRSDADMHKILRVPVGWKPLEVTPKMHHAILSLIERKKKEQESTASMLEARKSRQEIRKRRRELAGKELERVKNELEHSKIKKDDLTKKKADVFAKLKMCLNKETSLKKADEEKKHAELQRLQAKYPKSYETLMHCLQNPINQQSNSLISQQNIMFNQQALTAHLLSMQQIQQQQQQNQQLSNALTQQLLQQQLNASLPPHTLAQLQMQPMALGATQQLTQTLAKAVANQPLRPVPTASSQSAMGPPMYGRQPSRSFSSHGNKSIISPRRDTMHSAVSGSPRVNQLSRNYPGIQQEVKVEAPSPGPSPSPFYQPHPIQVASPYGGVKLEYGQNDNSAADGLTKAWSNYQQEQQARSTVPPQLLQPQLSCSPLIGSSPQLLSAGSNQLAGSAGSPLVINTGSQLGATSMIPQSFNNSLNNMRRDNATVRATYGAHYAAASIKDRPYPTPNSNNPQQVSPNVQRDTRLPTQHSNSTNTFSSPSTYRRK